MKAIKKIVTAAVAAVSIGAIGVTASADTIYTTAPVSWQAVYQNGAPSSVNKEYKYTIRGMNRRKYTVNCDDFNGGNGSVVTVTKPDGFTFKFTYKGSEDGISSIGSGGLDIFLFSALGSSANTAANGDIDW